MGPQNTLYVPASVLTANQNASVLIFELDLAPCEYPEDCYVEFVATPSINGEVHPLDKKLVGV